MLWTFNASVVYLVVNIYANLNQIAKDVDLRHPGVYMYIYLEYNLLKGGHQGRFLGPL
jgi:hypothetical protein